MALVAAPAIASRDTPSMLFPHQLYSLPRLLYDKDA